MTKGGRDDRQDRQHAQELLVPEIACASTTNANARPSAVQPTAHANARSSVFQATPQRVDPDDAGEPQIFSVDRRATNAASDIVPSLSCTAWIRIVKTGKNVNTATSSTGSPPRVPATNASPLKYPRPARPSDTIIANAQATRQRASPMPYCFPPAARTNASAHRSSSRWTDRESLHEKEGEARRADRDHAVGANPRVESGRQQRTASDEQQAASGSSHGRPCRNACRIAGALSLPAQSRSHAMPSTVSCSAYHGQEQDSRRRRR